MRKLRSTIATCAALFMARMFGRYEHTVYDGSFEYHRYRWRGEVWAFPKAPLGDA